MNNDLLTSIQRFNIACDFVLKHEGGFADNKNDPGGATNYGVSLRFLKAAGVDINNDGVVDETDIVALTKEKARTIYKKFWWDEYNYNAIHDLQIARKIFDLSINMGAKSSHKILQRAINEFSEKSIIVDGILGKITLNETNRISIDRPKDLLEEIKQKATHFYIDLCERNKSLHCFLDGWLNRVRDE